MITSGPLRRRGRDQRRSRSTRVGSATVGLIGCGAARRHGSFLRRIGNGAAHTAVPTPVGSPPHHHHRVQRGAGAVSLACWYGAAGEDEVIGAELVVQPSALRMVTSVGVTPVCLTGHQLVQ